MTSPQHSLSTTDPSQSVTSEMLAMFDIELDLRSSDSSKWNHYPPHVLPMWVADMDFPSPPAVVDALQQRIQHPVFGYSVQPESFKELLCDLMFRRHNWSITPEEIIFFPGAVSALNVVASAIGKQGDATLVNTPVYPPFLSAPTNQGRKLATADLATTRRHINGHSYLHYELDSDQLRDAITAETRLFIFCNPHNPVGRAYNESELHQVAALAEEQDMVICSDELHSDLLLGQTKHMPIAALAPEVAARTITLLAPSKTYNLPGLGCTIAIAQNPDLRTAIQTAKAGIVPHVNLLGYVAAEAAYRDGDAWLAALRYYLTDNRDYLCRFVAEELPGVEVTFPEATYLAWLDCRAALPEDNPYDFFLTMADVALSDGSAFGESGKGFVRLNFGCSRRVLQEGLQRIAQALLTQR
jgi:cysteine-S-conjugate beta-lyase